jgi:dTDP-4-amino-4,6-dideoxygalactose transaminase
VIGTNSRLDGIQAAVLSIKLGVLDAWNDERRLAAKTYAGLLDGLPGVVAPTVADGNEPVWHLYVVQVPERDRVVAELNAAGIGAGIHYPLPVHQLPAFADLGYGTGDFPVAERQAPLILSLPLYPGITGDQQERVVAELARVL